MKNYGKHVIVPWDSRTNPVELGTVCREFVCCALHRDLFVFKKKLIKLITNILNKKIITNFDIYLKIVGTLLLKEF